MTLNENLEKYYQLQKEIEEREEEMKSLKARRGDFSEHREG